MSIMHYIAADHELPLGESGKKRLKSVDRSKYEVKAIQINDSEEVLKRADTLGSNCAPVDIKEEETEVYESFQDAAGIYIQVIYPREEVIRKHFKNKYVYNLSPCFGNFALNEETKLMYPKMYSGNLKCLNALFDYIRANIRNNEVIELYTCWYGEEAEEKNQELTRNIDLKTFIMEDNFKLSEGQYIVVKR